MRISKYAFTKSIMLPNIIVFSELKILVIAKALLTEVDLEFVFHNYPMITTQNRFLYDGCMYQRRWYPTLWLPIG